MLRAYGSSEIGFASVLTIFSNGSLLYYHHKADIVGISFVEAKREESR